MPPRGDERPVMKPALRMGTAGAGLARWMPRDRCASYRSKCALEARAGRRPPRKRASN